MAILIMSGVKKKKKTCGLSLQEHTSRVFDVFLDLDKELDCLPTIQQAMIISQSKVHHRPNLNLAIDGDWPLFNSMQAKHSGLR